MNSFKVALICAQALLIQSVYSCLPAAQTYASFPNYANLGLANAFAANNAANFGYANAGAVAVSNAALNNAALNSANFAGYNGFAGLNGYNYGFGGDGTGSLACGGDLQVSGVTNVNGNLPASGFVQFNGILPATGLVSIVGYAPGVCSCPNNYLY